MVLFLDFDGVLHCKSGIPLENAVQLEGLIERFEDLRIVLSTSWVETYGYHEVVDMLPSKLRERVIGATFVSSQPHLLTRYEEIEACTRRMGIQRWLAIDDDDYGWPLDQRDHLVHCRPDLGLADPKILEELAMKLARLGERAI